MAMQDPFAALPDAAGAPPPTGPVDPFAALPAKAAQAAAAPSKGVLGYVDDAARALAQGATFGYADELAAAANTLPVVGSGKSYTENLAAEKARNEQIPGAIKYPGEIAGAVGSTIAAAPATAAAATATGLAKLPGIVRSILGGAAAGGAFGSGNAEPGQRLEGAGEGALIGGAAGGVIHPVIAGGAAVVNSLRNIAQPTRQAAKDLGRAIERDSMTPADVVARTQEAQAVRPGVATVADIGGENVQGLVERVAQTPGAGRTQVIPALTDRQKAQASRLTMDLASLTGTRRSALEATEQTMAQRAKDADPLYKQAMNFNAREVPEVVEAFQREINTGYGRKIVNSDEFKNTLQTEYGIADPTSAPLMVVIDAWQKAARDLGGATAQGGSKHAAGVIGDMRNRVLGAVDKANPAYAEARAAWAGPSQYLDAIEEGAKLASPKLGADEVRAALANMTGANREAYVTGALSSLFRTMGNTNARIPDVARMFESPQMREKIAALMPTPEAAAQWAQRLDFESKASDLARRALGNSRTAVRQAEQNDAATATVVDLGLDLAGGAGSVTILRKLFSVLPKHVLDTLRSRSDRVLADVLTNPNAASPQDLERVLTIARQQLQPRGITGTVAPSGAATEAVTSQ